jgi:phosphoglycolate phosphatase
VSGSQKQRATAARTLILFDIDGTLIHAAGAGVRGMNIAFSQLHGIANALDSVEIAGRTDNAIVTSAFSMHGLAATPDALIALRERYLDLLPSELLRAQSSEHFGVLPGVTTILETITGDDRFAVGLLTGNFEAAARIKLQHFGLWSYFVMGAFGDHHLNREDLGPVAVRRAAALGFPVRDVVVIGDTPLDVKCARANGAMAVAVTTGPYDEAALLAAGAHRVVGSLAELEMDELTDAMS